MLDVKEAQVFAYEIGGGIVFPANTRANGQSAFQVWSGLRISAPKLEKNAQLEKARRGVEVSLPQNLLAYSQGTLQVGVGLVVETLACQ